MMTAVREMRISSDVILSFAERKPEYKSEPGKNQEPEVPILFLHGFTGSSETMVCLAEGAKNRATFCLDFIGHGKSSSPKDSEHYSIESCCRHIDIFLKNLGITKFHLLGYSMGGRIGLSYALGSNNARGSAEIQSLTLISASPGLKTKKERDERREKDLELAKSIQNDGLNSFLKSWMHQPLFNSLLRLGHSYEKASYEQRMKSNPMGLMKSLEGMGLGSMKPLWSQLQNLNLPCLIITGSLDDKFTLLGREIQRKLPIGIFLKVRDTGHAPHLEKPELVSALFSTFLREIEKGEVEKPKLEAK